MTLTLEDVKYRTKTSEKVKDVMMTSTSEEFKDREMTRSGEEAKDRAMTRTGEEVKDGQVCEVKQTASAVVRRLRAHCVAVSFLSLPHCPAMFATIRTKVCFKLTTIITFCHTLTHVYTPFYTSPHLSTPLHTIPHTLWGAVVTW